MLPMFVYARLYLFIYGVLRKYKSITLTKLKTKKNVSRECHTSQTIYVYTLLIVLSENIDPNQKKEVY